MEFIILHNIIDIKIMKTKKQKLTEWVAREIIILFSVAILVSGSSLLKYHFHSNLFDLSQSRDSVQKQMIVNEISRNPKYYLVANDSVEVASSDIESFKRNYPNAKYLPNNMDRLKEEKLSRLRLRSDSVTNEINRNLNIQKMCIVIMYSILIPVYPLRIAYHIIKWAITILKSGGSNQNQITQ